MRKLLPSLITQHTVLSRKHLTPELSIRVIDQTCPLWTASEDQSPFKDPFWAFYWPGGQATARYILDNKDIVKDRRVLDVGCGCGAGSIAAVKMKAKRVVANDIDPYATLATEINAEQNGVSLETSTEDFLGTQCKEFDTILIGDMFYDEEFANYLFEWLLQLNSEGKKQEDEQDALLILRDKAAHIPVQCYPGFYNNIRFWVHCTDASHSRVILIGDPGRHGLTEKRRKQIKMLAKYVLPKESCIENHGFTETTVWTFHDQKS